MTPTSPPVTSRQHNQTQREPVRVDPVVPGGSVGQTVDLGLDQKKPWTRGTISTLFVPYTLHSRLRDEVQQSEDTFVSLTRVKKVRVVELGGDKLSELLGRNDPWGSGRSCTDKTCWTCKSRSWIRDQEKEARKQGRKLPEGMLQSKSGQCRREGVCYGIQCMDCLLAGRKTQYQGEASRSARERHKEHEADLRKGVTKSPLVLHTLEEHAGVRPKFVTVIGSIEPRPLYRAIRESVSIANLPAGKENLNRCQEWGRPRVPIMTLSGGDQEQGSGRGAPSVSSTNPDPEWTRTILDKIETQGLKRVKLWDAGERERDGEKVGIGTV